MNLLQSDILNARNHIQHDLGINPKVSTEWRDGEMSLVVRCDVGEAEDIKRVLDEKTAIYMPIVIEEDFQPKW